MRDITTRLDPNASNILRPSFLFIIKWLLLWLVFAAGGIALFVGTNSNYAHYVALALIVLPGLFTAAADIRRRCTTLQLDIKGLHLRHGVIVRKTKIIPLPRIATVDIDQGLLSRILRIGNVTIHSNDVSEDELFPSAHHPAQLQERIADMIQNQGQGLNQSLT